jgi:spore maturation protein CgeB
MNIAFFGSSLVSSYWNGAATYYRGLLKELAALDHQITFYEPDAFDRQQHRDIPDPPWAKVVVYPGSGDEWQHTLAQATKDADVLVKASGVGVFDRELEEALPQAARRHTICVYWDVDAPATLDAMAADEAHHLRGAIPHYDIVLTYGGGLPVISAYEKAGARECVPIYNALDPGTHQPVPRHPAYTCDLGFLGNRLPDRETRVEEFFLKAAVCAPDRQFLLGGSGWAGKPMPPNVRAIGHVGTAQHNAFFCSGLATLNINRDSMARYGFSPPTRVFEAAGAGACLITDRWAGIELFLEPGREVLVADDGAAVAEHVAALTPERAHTISQAARKRILAQHTYAHRAREVDALFNELTARAEAAA